MNVNQFTIAMQKHGARLTLLAAALASFASAASASAAADDAREACNTISLDDKLDMMHGFGPIAGYSRNSGCGANGRDLYSGWN